MRGLSPASSKGSKGTKGSNEPAATGEARMEVFGLISVARADETELFGYEITLSGSLVIPELCPGNEYERRAQQQTQQ